MFGNSTETFLPKLIDIGVDFAKASLRIALIIGIAYLGLRLLRVAFNRLETLLNRAAAAAEVTPGAATKRVLTLMSVLWTIVVGLVWFVVVFDDTRDNSESMLPLSSPVPVSSVWQLALALRIWSKISSAVSFSSSKIKSGSAMSLSSTAPEDWWKRSRFEPSFCVTKPRSFTYFPTDPSIHSRT